MGSAGASCNYTVLLRTLCTAALVSQDKEEPLLDLNSLSFPSRVPVSSCEEKRKSMTSYYAFIFAHVFSETVSDITLLFTTSLFRIQSFITAHPDPWRRRAPLRSRPFCVPHQNSWFSIPAIYHQNPPKTSCCQALTLLYNFVYSNKEIEVPASNTLSESNIWRLIRHPHNNTTIN